MVYPTRETAVQDMNVGGLYVFASLGQVLAVVTIDTQHEDEYNTVRWTTAEPALIVHRLCVDPEVQGQGIGRRLMEFVERYAVRQRFSSVRLDAYSGNPRALALYRQRGYREAGQVSFPRNERCHFIASNWISHQLKVLTDTVRSIVLVDHADPIKTEMWKEFSPNRYLETDRSLELIWKE